MHYYADKTTLLFAKASSVPLDNPEYLEIATPPKNGFSRWDGSAWVMLSESEAIETSQAQVATEEEIVSGGLPETVELPQTGGSGSGLSVEASGDLNISGEYLIDGRSIFSCDRQKAIATTEKQYDGLNWEQIPGLILTSSALSKTFYRIEVELLIKVSRRNRDFDFAIFINGEQSLDNTLSIDFNIHSDDRIINWSDEIELEPQSEVTVCWRRSSHKVVCYVGRRKLTLTELL